jgi:hypothetical protein
VSGPRRRTGRVAVNGAPIRSLPGDRYANSPFRGPRRCHDHDGFREEGCMEDFTFVLLTLVLFALLALAVKAVERL